ncbi:hypothetical protein SDRG_14496 [Saprolegnia diclina VS20]|uniref:Uncharacterized protein n=1 Tax=Saprolegnia diclina (strain VS20) TaxID=1156394 RepID=T0RDQ5_SAPDV|nr:hypothetical protein SDRG_14496 [Saprolegnia diclina VS20]EQC27747.1 hypothetical protein SDRG_14496 [Saprolegnia diclina VS20]|eukprot:XP_008618852.1 hypothetical protein SDRG_14496 [Saprolegnia diclina VS20]
MRVAPLETPRSESGTGARVSHVLGVLWLWLVLAGNIYCLLYVFGPRLANDLFWPHYNASGYQAYVVDALNELLETAPDASSVDLSVVTTEARYDSLLTTTMVHPTYTMALLTTKLSSLDHAVTRLRNMSLDNVLWLPTQYCWVDFNKSLELAHTATRQERCRRQYAANGAVYFEAVARNMDYVAFTTTPDPNLCFLLAIQRGLEASSVGVRWLDSVAHVTTTVGEEVAAWQLHGITAFRYQWQNVLVPRLDEAATLVNALGIESSLTLKSIASSHGAGSSDAFSGSFAVDVNSVCACNMSLIRDTPNFLNTTCVETLAQPFEAYTYAPFFFGATHTSLVRAALGPLGSIDLLVVSPPVALISLTRALSTAIYRELETASATRYAKLRTFTVAPTPPAWTTASFAFYGGSLLCDHGTPQTFLQPPFARADECRVQSLWTMSVSPIAMVSVLTLVNDSVESICGLVTSEVCESSLHLAQTLVPRSLNPILVQNATATTAAIGISVVQMAVDTVELSDTLLRQPLLETSSFAFYGWVLLLDWVAGKREVVSFQGDNGTLVVISDAYDTTAQTSPASRVLSQASITVYYLLVYSSLVLSALVLVSSLQFGTLDRPLHRSSIASFHRVASSTWLGRPLVGLRGATAMLVLSSAPVGIVRPFNLYTQLELPRRPLFETWVLAWEAAWASYVLHELMLPLTRHDARAAGMLSTTLLMGSCILLDVVWPVTVVASIDRSCTEADPAPEYIYAMQLVCNSSSIALGSPRRLLLLAVVAMSAVVLSVVIFHHSKHPVRTLDSLLVPGVAHAFYKQHDDATRRIDDICMGLLPWRQNAVLDIKLWAIVRPAADDVLTPVVPMLGPTVHVKSSGGTRLELSSRGKAFLWLIVGSLYVGLDLGSSFSYLKLLETTLSNDLVWPAFNITGAHVFLAKGMSQWSSTMALHDAAINQVGVFNTSDASIVYPIQHGAKVQYSTLTTLHDAISSLRKIDGCDGPWVFTQYCYLDFDGVWEMANSIKRQERCQSKVNNGAVFLASLLRNVDLSTCWNEEFEIGFGSELRQSTAGQTLLASFTPPYRSIDDEESHWASKSISSYTLQWQNYKSIGLLYSYSIVNAYGIPYSFSLQSTAGYYRIESQTSFKMYWSLANDLRRLTTNISTMAGTSLLRSSSRFAYRNASLQDVLVTEDVLPPLPWSANYERLSSHLGPFGSIDTVYISAPSVLHEAIAAFRIAVAGARRRNSTSYISILDEFYTTPVPTKWNRTIYAVSGSVLCPNQPRHALSLLEYVIGADAYQRSCASYYSALGFVPIRDHILFAVHLANIEATTTIAAVCAHQGPYSRDTCTSKIRNALAFLPYLPTLPEWRPSLIAAIQDLNVEWAQFGYANASSAPVELFHTPVFDPSDPTFDYFAWLFFYDWALGNREVISYQGDVNTLTLMGNTLASISQSADLGQLPTIFTLYARQAVQYVTISIIALALLSLFYLIHVRGAIEGRSLLQLSRVGGLVWVGRPLIGLRSITALSLLSSASVQLTTDAQLSYFALQAVPWYATCLAANEVTWLVGIVNDLGLPWTTWRLPKYALISSLLIWLVSALLAILAPVQASITVAPSCTIVSLDYQVQCRAGTVVIGSRARLLTLIGVVFACNVLCFSVARWYYREDLRLRSSSLLLCSGAKFLFRHENWIKHDVYYMDRASAVVNGLVSVAWRDEWVVLDVKTWRLHRLSRPKRSLLHNRLYQGLPLVNN